PIIEMSQRTVNLRVTVVIAARYREPTMGPQIVRIEMHRGHGMSGARRPLLIEATQQVVTLVPVKERLEERRFRQFSEDTRIVAEPPIRCIAATIAQIWQSWHDIVAHPCLEGHSKVCPPRCQ